MIGPCVPSTVRTTGASGAQSALFAQRSIARLGSQMESTRFMDDAPSSGRSATRAEQLRIPRREPWSAWVEIVRQRRSARDPPAHPCATEIGVAAEPNQKGGHARPL